MGLHKTKGDNSRRESGNDEGLAERCISQVTGVERGYARLAALHDDAVPGSLQTSEVGRNVFWLIERDG